MVKVRTYVVSTPWQYMDVRRYVHSSNLRPPNGSVSPTYVRMHVASMPCHMNTWNYVCVVYAQF